MDEHTQTVTLEMCTVTTKCLLFHQGGWANLKKRFLREQLHLFVLILTTDLHLSQLHVIKSADGAIWNSRSLVPYLLNMDGMFSTVNTCIPVSEVMQWRPNISVFLYLNQNNQDL